MAKKENRINIWWLLLSGTVLLAAAWFMKPFPIFIFFGLAPFFAMLDFTNESENFWERSELILLGLFVYFFAAYQFDVASIIIVVILAIVFTIPFLGFAYIHENLGPRTGKFIVIFLWLGLEFALLNLKFPSDPIFLADSLQFTSNWYRWNQATGYLGISAWILFANWIFYLGSLRSGINWYFLVVGLIVVTGPIVWSLLSEAKPVLRADMVALYAGTTKLNKEYVLNGELVARTGAWLSILIGLFAIVKARIKKK